MAEIELPWDLPLPYSQERCDEYECIGQAVVDQTIQVYDQFLANPQPDTNKWKHIKKRDNIQIYYSRERNPPSAFHKPLPTHTASPTVCAQAEWSPLVKLMATGTTRGSVDDAMYGAVSATEFTALMKSMSIQDQFYCNKTLRHIRLPTVDDPFTYCGLRWCASASKLASLVKARDMVLVESSGFRYMLINGSYERVGFVSYHSVDLPEITPLQSHGMLRSKYSACVLFRQQSPDVVDVFATVATQPGGDVLFKYSVFQDAEALAAVCSITESAMKKKLVWMQTTRLSSTQGMISQYTPMWRSMRQSFTCSSKLTCEQCSRELKMLSKTTRCEICATHVCSRCITSCKLVFGYTVDELEYRSTPTCKGCITTAREMDNSKALAVRDFVEPLDHLRESDCNVKQEDLSMRSRWRLSLGTLSISSETTHQCSTLHEVYGDEAIDLPPPKSIKTLGQFANQLTRERLRLWEQMSALCMQAEETHRFAMSQTRDMLKNSRA